MSRSRPVLSMVCPQRGWDFWSWVSFAEHWRVLCQNRHRLMVLPERI